MLGLAIRYGRLGDAGAIATLVNTNEIDIADMFERGSFLVLDRDQGGLAASVFLRISEGRGDVELLAIASDLDGADLSQRLLEVAEMVCVAKGCEAIGVHLAERDGLRDLSRELGFERLEANAGAIRLEKQLG